MVVKRSLPVPPARAAEVICPMPGGIEALQAKYPHLVDRPTLEDEPATPPATPAMQLASYASDMREAFPRVHDDEDADRLHRLAGAGYINATLAQD